MATIRPARASDAEPLSRLAFRSKAHWGYPNDFMEQCRAELSIRADDLARNPTFVLQGDESAAALGFYSLEPRSADEVELAHLFVEPDAIGRGYGRLLLQHARAEARGRGHRVLVIQSDPNAEAFYRACGARGTGHAESASIPGRLLPLLALDL